MTTQEKREAIIKYFMDNPCLSEPIDYQVDEMRLDHYTKEYNNLDDETINDIYRGLKEDECL
jgi:hypothetical protein